MQDDQAHHLPADRSAALNTWIRALGYVRSVDDAPETTLPGLFDDLAASFGDRPALLGEGEHFSYRDLAARANQFARWALAHRLQPGDVVGLLMPNRPEYVAVWAGLTRARCVVALINTNGIGDVLAHGLAVARCKHLIVDATLGARVEAIADRLPPDLQVWVHGEHAGEPWLSILPNVAPLGTTSITAAECPFPLPSSPALLIYTSGTTGLPKAAIITHARIVEWSFWFAGMMGSTPDDRIYNCLPMYHSVGGIIAIGAMLVKGGSVLIRARFSARQFWNDVTDGGCTIVQYIGELFRYLVHAPPHPEEHRHRLRLACGNGLQADVWTAAQMRFRIPHVLEFYAATEGSVSLYNCEGRVGAIGRIPPFLAHRFPVALVRCDIVTGEIKRGPDGFAIRCAAGDTGEAIGPIKGGKSPTGRPFDGYTDRAASEARILRDVFDKGDQWFRTGDLMRKDAAGFFFFVDRIGNSFRWKGENVSATEVASSLRRLIGVTDAVVFGVRVPGHEGRAGMAAITTDGQFDLSCLGPHLAATLPDYAQPRFVRLCSTLDHTGTFKLNKCRVMQEGYEHASEPVWFHDRRTGQFVLYDADARQAIRTGVSRL